MNAQKYLKQSGALLVWILTVSSVASSWAEPNRSPDAIIEDTQTLKTGSIVNSDANKILDQKKDLKPEFGYEDKFLTKGGSDVLDVQTLGRDPKKLVPQITATGIIVGDSDDPSGGRRIVAGTTPGTTQILIYEGRPNPTTPAKLEPGKLLKVYRITVTTEDLLSLLQELKALIGDVEGVEMRIVGQQVIVDGQVLIPKDMRRVLAVVNKYVSDKRPVVNLIEISPLSQKLLSEKMEEEIAGGKDRPRDIKVRVLNGRFFLEGNVDKVVDRETAIKICESYVAERYVMDSGGKVERPSFPQLGECVSMVRIRAGQAKDPDPIVSVRVDFVTVKRDYLNNFDFSWAPGTSLNGTSQYQSDTGKFLTNFTAAISNLFPKLNTAVTNNYARILKSATVLVRDGEDESKGGGAPAQATLNETLKIPVLLPASGTQPAQFTQVSVTTKIQVMARSIPGSDKLNLAIEGTEAEVQDAADPPSILEDSINTQIVVPNGESAALGGLVSESRSVGVGRNPADVKNGNPGFELFKLDKVQNFNDRKSQFVIFVTPTKLRTTTEGTDQLKRKFRLRK